MTLRDLDDLTAVEHRVLADPDIHASNTAAHPDRVIPNRIAGTALDRGLLTATLPARSWNVIRLSSGSSVGSLTKG